MSRAPSAVALKNDRSNHLGNAHDHLRSVVTIAKKFQDSGAGAITDQDIHRLAELSDKCSRTLKKYLNTRNFMESDQMLKAIDGELAKTLPYDGFDHEINWLRRFGELCVERCEYFISNDLSSPASINVKSIDDLYKQIISFREILGQKHVDPLNIKTNLEDYINEVLKIASGTGLVCEDGLKYYVETSPFCARSIWLGSKMFFHGTTNLLSLLST
jgi:hypothetical protein